MQKQKLEVYHGAGYDVVCGFEVKGRRYLAVRHTDGHVSETILVELTDEAIRRRDSDGSDKTIYRGRITGISEGDLQYLCSLQEGQDHFMLANFAIMRILGVKVSKLEGPEIARTLRGKVFALVA